MKAVGMEPQVLIDILVGAKIGVVYPFGTDHRGDLVVTSYALKQAGLPTKVTPRSLTGWIATWLPTLISIVFLAPKFLKKSPRWRSHSMNGVKPTSTSCLSH